MKNNNFSLNNGVVKKTVFSLKISVFFRCKLKSYSSYPIKSLCSSCSSDT